MVGGRRKSKEFKGRRNHGGKGGGEGGGGREGKRKITGERLPVRGVEGQCVESPRNQFQRPTYSGVC